MSEKDKLIIRDRSSRRQFLRSGTAFLLAGTTAAQAQDDLGPLRFDCDSRGGNVQKNPDDAGSDADSGAVADRPGCGRRDAPPKMTQLSPTPLRPKVGKISS